jgi:hypothetical protein
MNNINDRLFQMKYKLHCNNAQSRQKLLGENLCNKHLILVVLMPLFTLRSLQSNRILFAADSQNKSTNLISKSYLTTWVVHELILKQLSTPHTLLCQHILSLEYIYSQQATDKLSATNYTAELQHHQYAINITCLKCHTQLITRLVNSHNSTSRNLTCWAQVI